MINWQPIETAPVGVDVLVYDPELKSYWVAQRQSDPAGDVFSDGDGLDVPLSNFTHWAPLEPPK